MPIIPRQIGGEKKKERKNENLPSPLHFTTPSPISRAPSIKLDRSGSLPREANSIRVSCDRVKSTPRCEIGSWIIDSVACIVKGIEEWFPDFPFSKVFRLVESIASASDLKISHILTYHVEALVHVSILSSVMYLFSHELYFRNDRTSILRFSFNSKRIIYAIPWFFLVRIGIRGSREKQMYIYIYTQRR